MDRAHLYPTSLTTVSYFDKVVKIRTPDKEELFDENIAIKIAKHPMAKWRINNIKK